MSPGHSSLGTAARPPETITSGTRSLEVATVVKVRQRARSVRALIVSRITGAVARCSRSQWKFRADIGALLAAGSAGLRHDPAATRRPVHMIKLTETREITPYSRVHPDEER